MIQENEIRVGNYYNRVESYSSSLGYHKFSASVWYAIGECTDFLENYDPIPLTEEILLKCGFSKSVRPNCEDIYIDLPARMILWFNEGNYAEMDLIQDDKRISFKHSHIKHLHQLQNLYFCLCGKELNVEL